MADLKNEANVGTNGVGGKLIGDEWYPYYEPGWTAKDQAWCCGLVNRYKVPITVITPLYRYLIEQGKCNTFEVEYQRYKEFLAEHGIDPMNPR
ncbi:hypothetical protein [Bacillus phage CP-51]|uniref:Uncharacterized protein n=1 Tax=Bacillus phage CP-51 TaxID=1391188 RepID=A0A068EQ76_9CAUD|nr:hypothetical protein OZ73_gp042 [Bacillus phage CP-51]AID50477.1 hypothetical protein [Bacillus phage CP-51]